MKSQIDRRRFLQRSGVFLASTAVPGMLGRPSLANAQEFTLAPAAGAGFREVQTGNIGYRLC